jgi:4-amino-4-deoxy-L-arabinose transferase-like glycosyltransferase
VATTDDNREPDTLAEAVLGKAVLNDPRLKGLRQYTPAQLAAGVACAFASLVLLPYLGAVGLWDPWETHYGEVAREMIQRNDYVHPFWENAWFFSKPVFTMWMHVVGMAALGSDLAQGNGALGLYTEWGFRLPFALFSITGVTLMTYAIARIVSVRAGLATGFVLTTTPIYFLISRQAVTDTPIISATLCGMACAFVGLFDKETKKRHLWWYAFWAFLAAGTLAKGLLGFGIPAVILFLYALLSVVPWSFQALDEHFKWLWRVAVGPLGTALAAALVAAGVWTLGSRFPLSGLTPGAIVFAGVGAYLMGKAAAKEHLAPSEKKIPIVWNYFFQMRFGSGMALFLLMAAPWYHEMFTFESVDDEGKLFWYRFLIHDHFARLAGGVHTTTPGGTFTYFIEQGGYAVFPWVALVPGALAVALKLKLRGGTGRDAIGVMAVVWLTFTFYLIGSSATKFHHYVLPMVLPFAIL